MNPEDVQQLIENSNGVEITFVGTRTSDLGVEENVGVDDEKRLIHTVSIGPTGYGKTQVIVHVVLQDIHKGHGVCMLVPKGDGIQQVLAKIPEERIDDVIYINPSGDTIPGINVLEPHTDGLTKSQKETQKEIIVSNLIDLFKRQSENWGDQFGRVLETLLRAHLDLNVYHNGSYSLLDVFRCVINDDQLTELIDRTEDPVIREQLVRVKEDMSSYQMEPLQRRLNDFVMNPIIRDIVASETSSIDFSKALETNAIVLVEVQKGQLGETVAQLVGSIVLTQIWAAAQSRITDPIEERTPFYLYVDELQTFASEGSAFATMLSEAREYRLGCWLATQYLSNLESTTLREAVMNNCRTKVIFNPLGSDNDTRLLNHLNGVERRDLTSLGQYRAILQAPSEHRNDSAVIVDTYPPWDGDRDRARNIARRRIVDSAPSSVHVDQSLGTGATAGGDQHGELLAEAKRQLEDRGFQVNLLYQEQGADKPDGTVIMPDGSVAHLEAEQSTLSKPAKVLRNFQRAAEQDNECIFVVEAGKTVKLQNIVEDPVNRRGSTYEDEYGRFDYYADEDGEFTDLDALEDGEYRIIAINEDDMALHEERVTPECPELDHHDREDLLQFCLYREDDGYCTALGQDCVLQE